MIYFIRELRYEQSPVKIGYSRTEIGAEKRLTELQTGNPRRLAIVAMTAGSRDAEMALHKLCISERIHGEWFRFAGSVPMLVAQYALAEPLVYVAAWEREGVLDRDAVRRSFGLREVRRVH